MLSDKFRFVCLDFETTGLDREKDEPIQIGIVEYNSLGEVVSEFSSLIKPKKNISELRGVVSFITGLSLEDLENAPSVDDIQEQVSKYFDEKTIIIGHNIDFDIFFLKKYFSGIEFCDSVDTYLWALNFVHFAPSYALEVLIEYLSEKDSLFQKLNENLGKEANYHDALVDSKLSWILFDYFVHKIEFLFKEYSDLPFMVQQQDSFLLRLLDLNVNQESHFFKVPSLEKYVPQGASLANNSESVDLEALIDRHRYFVGNIPFDKLLANLASNKKVIFAFSHKQKLDIAKRSLQNLGVKNVGFARGNQVLNSKVFEAFVNKGNFSENEVFFLLKYFSHHQKGLGVLDLNSAKDYQVFALLKEEDKLSSHPLILTTHGGLYNLVQQGQKFQDYKIVFFDQEWWYNNFNSFVSRSCDLYYSLQFIEKLVYVYGVRNQIKISKYDEAVVVLESLLSSFQIFMGVVFMETKNLFRYRMENNLQYEPILGNGIFHETNALWKNLLVQKNVLSDLLLEQDFGELNSHFEHIEDVFSSIVNIQRRIQAQGEVYFVFNKDSQYTQREEFLEFFGDQKISFLSNSNRQYIHLDAESQILPSWETKKLFNKQRVLEFIQENIKAGKADFNNVFILSSLKDQSRELFDELYQNGVGESYLLLAENITGGVGKTVFKIQNSEKNIIIGSYNLLMWLFAKGISIDNLVVFNIRGKMKDLMMDDLFWYGGGAINS